MDKTVGSMERKSPRGEISDQKQVLAKPSSTSVTSSKPKIESNVIKIIQREWEKEVERLEAKKTGFKAKH